MPNYWYVHGDQSAGLARAAALGCGYLPAVPAQALQPVGATALPVVIVAGSGQTVVLPDDGLLTQSSITAAAAPIVAAEQAARDASAAQQANADATTSALTAAMTRLTAVINQANTLSAQSTAWTVPQQRAVAQALSDMALIERRLIRATISLRDAAD